MYGDEEEKELEGQGFRISDDGDEDADLDIPAVVEEDFGLEDPEDRYS